LGAPACRSCREQLAKHNVARRQERATREKRVSPDSSAAKRSASRGKAQQEMGQTLEPCHSGMSNGSRVGRWVEPPAVWGGRGGGWGRGGGEVNLTRPPQNLGLMSPAWTAGHPRPALATLANAEPPHVPACPQDGHSAAFHSQQQQPQPGQHLTSSLAGLAGMRTAQADGHSGANSHNSNSDGQGAASFSPHVQISLPTVFANTAVNGRMDAPEAPHR
jgi:hypothetical protein